MQDNLSKLVSLLEHKHHLLQELIRCQEQFKTYLAQPEWSRFNEMTRPQEDMLLKLRQIQAAQDYLLGELSRDLNLPKIKNLKSLCAHLEPEWQRVILECIAKVRVAVEKLQELSRLSMALNQAEWRFNRDLARKAGGPAVATNVYNAHGYAQQTTFTQHCVSREV